MKHLKPIIIALMLASASAQAKAVDFEVSIGTSKYGLVGSGIWFDENYPHSLDVKDTAFSIGVVGSLNPVWGWRAGYLDLGELRTTSIGLSNDLQPERGFLSTFVTSSHVRGLYGSFIAGTSLYAEFGLFAFRPDFQVMMYDMIYDLPDGVIGRENIMASHREKVSIQPFIGFGYQYKQIRAGFAYYSLDNKETDQYSTIYKDVTTFMVAYRF